MRTIAQRREHDRSTAAQQAPIAGPRYCVLYRKDRKEHRTAWFHSADMARRALGIIQLRYGDKNAIIYKD